MICFRHPTPLLQIGSLPPVHCDRQWLRTQIADAAAKAGVTGSYWMGDDIADAILLYLENHFPGGAIPLDQLRAKARQLFHNIGAAHIARHLDLTPPPAHLDLDTLAADAGEGFELSFFTGLAEKLDELARNGIPKVELTGLKPCVKTLRRARSWRKDCEALAAEICAFLQSIPRPQAAISG